MPWRSGVCRNNGRTRWMRNRKLYLAMKQIFGETPRIINEGEPCRLVNVYAEYSFVPQTQDLLASQTPGGEQYAVNCPFCGDTRQRLYISHMWDAEFVQNNCRYHCAERLMHCFNEDCTSILANRSKLANSLREAMGSVSEIDEEAMSVEAVELHNELANQCLFPAETVKVNDASTPIEVQTYLAERGFDRNYLAEQWEVGWLARYGKFSYPMLVIPVYQNDEYWFWQGRLVPVTGHVGDTVEYDSTTMRPFPKYYFPHGVKKAWALYNIDRARTHDTIFLVEGVTDAWAIGEQAVARFGKQLSGAQVQLLVNQCPGKHIIIVPDGDDPQALDAAKEDAMRLEVQAAFASVKLAELPEGKDPGDLVKMFNTREEIVCHLKSEAISPLQARAIPTLSGSLAIP